VTGTFVMKRSTRRPTLAVGAALTVSVLVGVSPAAQDPNNCPLDL
jgi:hypothetical protein